jgi:hypothetical protein
MRTGRQLICLAASADMSDSRGPVDAATVEPATVPSTPSAATPATAVAPAAAVAAPAATATPAPAAGDVSRQGMWVRQLPVL